MLLQWFYKDYIASKGSFFPVDDDDDDDESNPKNRLSLMLMAVKNRKKDLPLLGFEPTA